MNTSPVTKVLPVTPGVRAQLQQRSGLPSASLPLSHGHPQRHHQGHWKDPRRPRLECHPRASAARCPWDARSVAVGPGRLARQLVQDRWEWGETETVGGAFRHSDRAGSVPPERSLPGDHLDRPTTTRARTTLEYHNGTFSSVKFLRETRACVRARPTGLRSQEFQGRP